MNTFQASRKAVSKLVSAIVKPCYFQSIPLDELFSACESNGLIPIMESGEKWQGFLCGEDGHCLFVLAPKETETVCNGATVYCEGRAKAGLSLAWHKMESGKYEVLAYVR